MATVGQTVPAVVKSAATSKVNLIASIGGALTAIAGACAAPQVVAALPLIPAPWGGYATIFCALATGAAVVWTRTFHTTSILAPSLPK